MSIGRLILSNSLRLSLRLRLSIGLFEPLSGPLWTSFSSHLPPFQEQFYIDSRQLIQRTQSIRFDSRQAILAISSYSSQLLDRYTDINSLGYARHCARKRTGGPARNLKKSLKMAILAASRLGRIWTLDRFTTLIQCPFDLPQSLGLDINPSS